MPNTRDRKAKQPNSQEERKRQQSNDSSPRDTTDEDTDDAAEPRIKAPGERDDDDTTLRTDEDSETGEDEDLPEGDLQGNSNPGNFANDREKASDAGRKGGQR